MLGTLVPVRVAGCRSASSFTVVNHRRKHSNFTRNMIELAIIDSALQPLSYRDRAIRITFVESSILHEWKVKQQTMHSAQFGTQTIPEENSRATTTSRKHLKTSIRVDYITWNILQRVLTAKSPNSVQNDTIYETMSWRTRLEDRGTHRQLTCNQDTIQNLKMGIIAFVLSLVKSSTLRASRSYDS